LPTSTVGLDIVPWDSIDDLSFFPVPFYPCLDFDEFMGRGGRVRELWAPGVSYIRLGGKPNGLLFISQCVPGLQLVAVGDNWAKNLTQECMVNNGVYPTALDLHVLDMSACSETFGGSSSDELCQFCETHFAGPGVNIRLVFFPNAIVRRVANETGDGQWVALGALGVDAVNAVLKKQRRASILSKSAQPIKLRANAPTERAGWLDFYINEICLSNDRADLLRRVFDRDPMFRKFFYVFYKSWVLGGSLAWDSVQGYDSFKDSNLPGFFVVYVNAIEQQGERADLCSATMMLMWPQARYASGKPVAPFDPSRFFGWDKRNDKITVKDVELSES
jgi:hypothetical protein